MHDIQPAAGFLLGDKVLAEGGNLSATVYDCAGTALATWQPAATLSPLVKSQLGNAWSFIGSLPGGAVNVSRDNRTVLMIHPDMQLALILGPDGVVHDLGGNQKQARLSSDGRHVATIDAAGSVVLWDAASGSRLCAAAHHGTAVAIAFSSDHAHLAIGDSDGALSIVDVPNCVQRRSRPGNGAAINFSAIGETARSSAAMRRAGCGSTMPTAMR